MATGKSILISASILSADFSRLGDEVREVVDAGSDWIHVDVMDGHFVPNITIGPMVVAAVKKITSVPLDVHLMISNPDQYLEAFCDAGADVLSVHPEVTHHLHRTLSRIRELGMKAGAALNPSTGLDAVEYVLPEIDVLMLMTVNPGFGGQSFIKTMSPKIRATREKIDQSGYDILIEVDGGVSPQTAPGLAQDGVDVFVSGSAIFGHPPYRAIIEQLKNSRR